MSTPSILSIPVMGTPGGALSRILLFAQIPFQLFCSARRLTRLTLTPSRAHPADFPAACSASGSSPHPNTGVLHSHEGPGPNPGDC